MEACEKLNWGVDQFTSALNRSKVFCGLENESHYIIHFWKYSYNKLQDKSIYFFIYENSAGTRPLKLEITTLPEKTARVNYVYTEESEFLEPSIFRTFWELEPKTRFPALSRAL